MFPSTNKGVEFLSNEELIQVLSSVLEEIDIIVEAGAHRSATYLAVSTIEGVCREIIRLKKLNHKNAPKSWPMDKNGPIDLSQLNLQKLIEILKETHNLPTHLEDKYDLLRQFRNYIHPDNELRNVSKLQRINQSVAQLSLSCLNALLEQYGNLRFVGSHEWVVEYGMAQVPSDNVIRMPQYAGQFKSLLISSEKAQLFHAISFVVDIPRSAIFNFVYNYTSKDDFMAARIEGRGDDFGFHDGKLRAASWNSWHIVAPYTPETAPKPSNRQHTVDIVFSPFSIQVDGIALVLQDKLDWEFDPNKRIGFLSEHGLVSILDLQIQ
ncbi:MAG: hypothetical protein JNJ61_09810 [Anaerolineae bacterium]|nr:hypothetical protein [Anaerolineae bacterium]